MPKLRFNFNLINAVHSVPNCCSSRWIEWKMMIIIAYLFISKKLRVANFAHFQLCVCVCVFLHTHFTWFHLVLPTYGGIQQNFPQGISSRLPARIVRVCVRVCMGLCVHGFVCVWWAWELQFIEEIAIAEGRVKMCVRRKEQETCPAAASYTRFQEQEDVELIESKRAVSKQ